MPSAHAADLTPSQPTAIEAVGLDPSSVDVEVAAAASSGATRKVLFALARAARRAGAWWLWARDVADALDEIIRIMDDARHAARLREQLDAMEKRLDLLARELDAKRQPDRSDAAARRLLEALRQEIARTRHRGAHKPCPTAQHRLPDRSCHDRRLLPTPGAP